MRKSSDIQYCEKDSPNGDLPLFKKSHHQNSIVAVYTLYLAMFAASLLFQLSLEAQGKERSSPGVFQIDSIPLPDGLARAENEFSGLQIHKRRLYLLAESRILEKQEAAIYYAPVRDLQKVTKNSNSIPHFQTIKIYGLEVLQSHMPEYEGLEAFIIKGRKVYLTVETSARSPWAYLIRGKMKKNVLVLDSVYKVVRKPHKSNGNSIHNAAFEAIILNRNKIFAFFEYNYFENNFVYSIPVNFSKPIDSIPIAKLPFRVSDITGKANNYTGINIFYNGSGPDTVYRVPVSDSAAYQLIFSNKFNNYTRLIRVKFLKSGFAWEPIFELPAYFRGYNWEGIARWKKGYFLINDKYTPFRPYHSILLYLY